MSDKIRTGDTYSSRPERRYVKRAKETASGKDIDKELEIIPSPEKIEEIEQDINQLQLTKEDTSNKVTSLSSESTDEEYPSAKAVYDIVGNVESLLAEI